MCISKTAAVSTEVKTKMPPKPNTIPIPQKTEMLYPQTTQQTQTDFMPMQVVQKPLFVQHHQPQPAMIIIAQPALLPQNVIYGGHPLGLQQQLLNYFHTNPQAKYQLLYGGYQPHPTAQTYVPHVPVAPIAPVAAPTVAAYQIVPNPVVQGYNHLVAAPSQVSYNQAAPFQQNHIGGQYVQPMQLNQLAHLAQMTAQQFGAPIKSFPPIITGLENFTPEQQAQIKSQLGVHLGGQFTTSSTVPTTTAQYSQQLSTQPAQSLSTADYMQNNDKTNPQASGSNFSPSLVYRAQYTKG